MFLLTIMCAHDLKVKVSRYMSYLLRHNPENLKMNRDGFVDLNQLLKKLNERFQIDKRFVYDIVEKRDRKRFEIVENKIRAFYGHTIPVNMKLAVNENSKVFYHGTTPEAASKILKEGLKPMKRRWVHLSPTMKMAKEVGLRRTRNPIILEIDAEAARKKGLRFYKATDKVYLSGSIQSRYIKLIAQSQK